jgi:sterol desaturase/sphingolipid hydroxylase (fatty acid hydroxylase superfamily)
VTQSERTEVPAAEARARSITSYRAKAMDPTFTLARHLFKTLGVAAAILAGGLWLALDAAAWHWALLPVFWLVANIFEWGIHRYAMHRPAWPRVLYHNHARVHHNAFAGSEQEIRGPRELSLVMMPWYTLIMVFLMASPVALLATAVGGPALAGVFLIGSVTYFLLYEVIHTLHHLPGRMLAPTGVLAGLRAHHHHHHQLERMAHVNFNVTLPIADRVLGTYARSDASRR